MSRFALAIVVVGSVASADSNFWHPEPQSNEREAHVAQGDASLAQARDMLEQYARQFMQQNIPEDAWPCRPPAIAESARDALADYEAALAIPGSHPDAAELHFRALFAAAEFLNESKETCPEDDAGYQAEIKHLDGLRAADPMDPRIPEFDYAAALAYSKLAAHGGPDAEAFFGKAVDEYELWRRTVDQANPILAGKLATSYSNEAELLMAAGRIDDAIAYYQRSTELESSEGLNWFGLAIASDRDGQTSRADAAIRIALACQMGLGRLTSFGVFFVPQGDLQYYLGLANEVRGDKAEALRDFERFLAETRGTRYLDRARDHITALEKQGVKDRDDGVGGLGLGMRP